MYFKSIISLKIIILQWVLSCEIYLTVDHRYQSCNHLCYKQHLGCTYYVLLLSKYIVL